MAEKDVMFLSVSIYAYSASAESDLSFCKWNVTWTCKISYGQIEGAYQGMLCRSLSCHRCRDWIVSLCQSVSYQK